MTQSQSAATDDARPPICADQACECGHRSERRDPIAARYCQATGASHLNRGCICTPVRHYAGPLARSGTFLMRRKTFDALMTIGGLVLSKSTAAPPSCSPNFHRLWTRSGDVPCAVRAVSRRTIVVAIPCHFA